MLAKVHSASVFGVDAREIEIEINIGRGDPSVIIVGLPDAAVKESKDRVITALHNSGFRGHKGRTTINLAPANVKKEGPSFDLPIAIGILAAKEDIRHEALDSFYIVGELALSGEIRSVKGVLPITICAKENGYDNIIVPMENAEEAAVVDGINVFPANNIIEAIDIIENPSQVKRYIIPQESFQNVFNEHEDDFADVKGQEGAKRAIEVAVSGGHNILMIGPPGTGKTMLAKRIPSILPSMSFQEAIEITKIQSVSGLLPSHCPMVKTRPFRSPHHTISDAGLLGGGVHPTPGEVSLAHRGVLFLDELPEFRRNVLEVMRQPLEDGVVTIARAAATLTFPSEFMLVAAMNPCKCGYYGDLKRECRCTPRDIHNYRDKISGPLLDRIDIHIQVPSVQYSDLASKQKGESSAEIRKRVMAAREIQYKRFENSPGRHCNADMNSKDIEKYCLLKPESDGLLKAAISQLNLSARSYSRILKVARTIADLANSSDIEAEHIAEAIQYRSLDRQNIN